MAIYHNKNYVPLAQQLRKEMTPEENHLWYDFLKKLPCTVNRQKNIGNYIVDFYIPSARLVIEATPLKRNILYYFITARPKSQDICRLFIHIAANRGYIFQKTLTNQLQQLQQN